MLDIQIERRHEHFTPSSGQPLGKVVTIGLGLQFVLRDDDGMALVKVDADSFSALGIEIANLIVDRAPPAEAVVFAFEFLAGGRIAGQAAVQGDLLGQIEQIGFDRFQIAVDDVGLQIDEVSPGLFVQALLRGSVLEVQGQNDNAPVSRAAGRKIANKRRSMSIVSPLGERA